MRAFLGVPFFMSILTNAAPVLSDANLNKIDKVVQKQIDSQKKVGIVIGLFADNRSIFRSYGKTELNSKAMPNERSLFEIGSVTKVFTATALATLVRSGLIDLELPVSHYLPELAKSEVAKTKLKELIAHTSGLPGMFEELQRGADPLNPFKDIEETLFIEALKAMKRLNSKKSFDPSNYSNVGPTILGLIISRVSSTPYEQFVLKNTIQQLELANTYFSIPTSQKDLFISGYNSKIQKTPHWEFKVFSPAGALHSSATDMLQFVQKNIVANHGSTGVLRDLLLTQKIQAEGKNLNIGLGWFYDKKSEVYYHRGGTLGFTSLVAFQKNKKLGLVILSNTGYLGDRVYVDGVEELVFGRKLAL